MRQVYALLGLVKKWGAERVEAACARALEAEAINVGSSAACSSGPPRTAPSSRRPPGTSSGALRPRRRRLRRRRSERPHPDAAPTCAASESIRTAVRS